MQQKAVDGIWQKCLSDVKETLSSPSSRVWFEETEAVSIQGTTLTLKAPSKFARDWIDSRYSMMISRSASESCGEPIDVKIVAADFDFAPSEYVPIPQPRAAAPAHNNGSYSDNLSSRYSFDSFVIGGSNRFTHAAAVHVAESPADIYNPLFMYGASGLGKTHLLHAIGRQVRQIYPELVVRYVSTETFMNEMINAIKDRSTEDFKKKYRSVDVLLIDDIQFLEGKDVTQEEFFHTFNALHSANRQLVITSDRPPKAIPTLEDRLRTRFEWGLITDIQPPDLETRIAILRKVSEREGMQVDPDVVEFIASRISDSVRELEGALIRVTAYATLNKTAANIQLAEEVLGDLLPNSGAAPVNVDWIISEVAGYYNYVADELRSSNRSRPLVHARQVAMYLVREFSDLSLPKIGEAFHRDHTTVLHAQKKVQGLIQEKRNVYLQIQDLTQRIKSKSRSR